MVFYLIVLAVVVVGLWLADRAAPGVLEYQQEIGDELQPPSC
jgi:hypothetical protein